MKKQYMLLILATLFFSASFLPGIVIIPPVAAQSITQGPTVNLLYNTSVVIMWKTDTAVASTVEYDTDTTLDQSVSDSTPATEHRLEVSGLTPNTIYYYRAGDGSTWSDVYQFMTAPDGDEPFTFLYYGDHRPSGGTTVPDEVLQLHDLMVTENASFIISGGDLIQDEPYDVQSFINFQAETDRLQHNACYWVVTGNHDYPSHKELEKFYEWPGEDTRKYYSFDYGNAHFTVLNSEEGFNSGDTSWGLMTEYYLTNTQIDWMKADLAATTKKHRFILTHRPIFPASWRATDINETAAEELLQIFDDYYVEAILVSHDHLYARYEIGSIPQYISGGGGAPLSHDLIFNRYATEKASLIFHYFRVEVVGDQVTWTAIDINGNVFDTWTTYSVLNQRPKASGISSSPLRPLHTDNVIIEATVTDDAPPSTVTVKYRRDNTEGWTWPSNYTSSSMALVSGNLYQANLGAFPDQQGFYYFVEVNDTAGNTWVSKLYHFGVDEQPAIATITQPTDGATVQGTQVVVAHVEDGVGVAYIEFYLDDVLVQNSSVIGANVTEAWTWSTPTTPDGLHTVKIIAYDIGGNSAEATITVYVNNAGTPSPTPIDPLLIGGIVVVVVVIIIVLVIFLRRRK